MTLKYILFQSVNAGFVLNVLIYGYKTNMFSLNGKPSAFQIAEWHDLETRNNPLRKLWYRIPKYIIILSTIMGLNNFYALHKKRHMF